MTGRLGLRTRMALVWGVGFFVLGGLLVATIGVVVRERVADDPGNVTRLIVSELGLEAEKLGDLTIGDGSGHEVTADQIVPLLRAVARSTRADIARTLWLVVVTLAIVAAAAGWWLARHATRPIAEITAHARQVSSERLDARIGLKGPKDELRDLADAFDTMMDRLEHAFAAQQHFAAAASHELRTPLTVIRTELDVGLDTPDPSREELDEMAEGIRFAIDRSEKVIDGLLMLARSGIVEPHASIDLTRVIDECLEDHADRITDRGLSLRPRPRERVEIKGDLALIERMVRNLVDNAVVHTRDDGWIEVGLVASHGEAIVTITNPGSELAPDAIARLVEPFYRGGSDGRVPGTGLGLAIATSIAEAHGGRLGIDPLEGGGITVTVRLPMSSRRNRGDEP